LAKEGNPKEYISGSILDDEGQDVGLDVTYLQLELQGIGDGDPGPTTSTDVETGTIPRRVLLAASLVTTLMEAPESSIAVNDWPSILQFLFMEQSPITQMWSFLWVISLSSYLPFIVFSRFRLRSGQ